MKVRVPSLGLISRSLISDRSRASAPACAATGAMCWNAPVSIAFGLLGVACASFLFYVGREAQQRPGKPLELFGGRLLTNYWSADCKWHALWVMNIACVELSEFIIWLNVLPFEIELQGGTSCPAWNKFGTFGVFLFGFANWSWVIGVWCHGTTSASTQPLRRRAFSIWRVFAILVSFFFVLQLFIGEVFEIGVRHVANLSTSEIALGSVTRPVYYRFTTDLPLPLGVAFASELPDALAAQLLRLRGAPVKTCSFQEVGRYPHLHWRFAWAEEPWLPSTGWTFFATMFLPFFFYKPAARAVLILLWGFFTYTLPIALLPVEETMSVF